jgi:septal ring factor EnvC (AmiA/AmiB activator)
MINLEEVAAGSVVSRIRKDLEEAADKILELSKQVAKKNQELNALKDDQASREAKWRVQVATVLNEQNKPKYANLDAQNAAVTMALNADDDYAGHKIIQLDTALEIEMLKAQLIRLHEKRRDSRTEAELLVGLLKG